MGSYYNEARDAGANADRVVASSSPTARTASWCAPAAGRGSWRRPTAARADAGGKTIGLNIGLPFEQFPNPYITPELSFEFHYFFMRKFWFAYLAKALVVFPGGFGTLDEMMEILTLTQTQKLAKKMTMVLYGSEYWKEIINFDALVKYGMISPRGSEPVPVRRRSADRIRDPERRADDVRVQPETSGDAGDFEIAQPAEAHGRIVFTILNLIQDKAYNCGPYDCAADTAFGGPRWIAWHPPSSIPTQRPPSPYSTQFTEGCSKSVFTAEVGSRKNLSCEMPFRIGDGRSHKFVLRTRFPTSSKTKSSTHA